MNNAFNPENIISQVIEKSRAIDHHPEVKDLEHRIALCDKWLAERNYPEISGELTRLYDEERMLEAIIEAVEENDDEVHDFFLSRLNGSNGKYNDVSGGTLGIVNSWKPRGLILDYPKYSRLSKKICFYKDSGNYIEVEDSGVITLHIVSSAVDKNEDPDRDEYEEFVYSDKDMQITTIRFVSLQAIKSRLIEAHQTRLNMEADPEIDLTIKIWRRRQELDIEKRDLRMTLSRTV